MSYLQLKTYYESCLKQHGATHEGVDWPNMEDLTTRFGVMTDWMDWHADAPLSILDVGCGPGFYLDYLNARYSAKSFSYTGIDISPEMINAAHTRTPGQRFEARDLIKAPLAPASVDYGVFNGVFTVRDRMSEADMTRFAVSLLSAVFPSCRKGLAVNFMAPHADYYDETLFYLSFDAAARMFKANLSRHITFRSDYGLWEYTAYVHTDAQRAGRTK